jgi:lysophospholipase L1-like esterase
MTAHELNLLIDILERRGENRQLEAATMLLQQQAEIEALKLRELTTEEIDEHFNQSWYQDDSGVHFDHYGFAKAILKKASEK